MPDSHRFGVIALAGPPNAGKSTLLNRIVGRKISIISRRPQTTRHRILGIKTMPEGQLVFVDTPGLHQDQPRSLNRVINRTAINSLTDVDIIVFMIDFRGWDEEREKLLDRVASRNVPVILVINKIDLMDDRSKLLPLMEESAHRHEFLEIIPMSALKQKDLNDFIDTMLKAVPEGPPGFPADQLTDRSERFLASELVREQTFRMLGQELPYCSAVEVTRFEYDDDRLLNIGAIIWVEKPGQKPIVIGKGGKMLKAIGQQARKQIESAFGIRVYLELWVKVRKGWADNASMLQSLGYDED